MHIEIVPFRDTHLEEAADLLALRHQRNHALEPALPLRFKQSVAARAAVEATWRKPDASGVVALYSGRVIGYLIGIPRIDLVWGRSVWVPLAGHAIDRTCGDEVYRDLYAALSPSWVALGCYAHYALIPASDRPALEAWFALSSGKEQAHGIRETAQASALTAPVDPTLTIRRAGLADLEASLELDEIIPPHQSRAPVYAPYWFGEYAPFGNTEAIRQESLEILRDEQAKLWLALRNGRMVGYQLYVPAAPEMVKNNDIMVPDQCSYLAVAATKRATAAAPKKTTSTIRCQGPSSGHTAFGTTNRAQITTATTGAPIASSIFAIIPCPVWKPQYPRATSTHNSSKNANVREEFI